MEIGAQKYNTTQIKTKGRRVLVWTNILKLMDLRAEKAFCL
jgi:hypothetical protein